MKNLRLIREGFKKKNKVKGGSFRKMGVNFYDKEIRKLIGTHIFYLAVKKCRTKNIKGGP